MLCHASAVHRIALLCQRCAQPCESVAILDFASPRLSLAFRAIQCLSESELDPCVSPLRRASAEQSFSSPSQSGALCAKPQQSSSVRRQCRAYLRGPLPVRFVAFFAFPTQSRAIPKPNKAFPMHIGASHFPCLSELSYPAPLRFFAQLFQSPSMVSFATAIRAVPRRCRAVRT